MIVERLVLSLCLGFSAIIGHAQEINVRLIDFRNGRPLKGARLEAVFHDAAHAELRVALQTDQDGRARFALPSPAPVSVGVFSQLWLCDAGHSLPPSDLVQTGVVQKGNCKLGRSVVVAVPKPGELTVYARPAPWWAPIWGHIIGS